MPANLENLAVATGLEKVSFHSNPKERQCQRMLKLPHNCTHLTRYSFSQWGMQAVTNAYQKTSNAISKAIKKNKVKLKYGTFVYLVNGKEKRK